MIFVTGDKHGDFRVLSKNIFDSGKLTKKDYVIIAGDFGLVWDESKEERWWLKWLQKKNFTTLFVDGNHENHETLDNLACDNWGGGRVHYINDSVIHLMRGQVYHIDGCKIFTFGGADSVDKEQRKAYISWWPRELPSYAEYEEGLYNLSLHNNQVDYVITHTCPSSVLENMVSIQNKNIGAIETYFEVLSKDLNFKHWYFGHFHVNARINDKFTTLYNDIVRLT